ncbi:MAG: heparinase II/III family protein [Rhizobiales bacterium]|nr:heparinase II/III family protein [Hyphomicrobiales bacterium]
MAGSSQLIKIAGLGWYHNLRGGLYRSRAYRWRFGGRSADRLLLAPQDIRTSDPVMANELFGGRFSLGGSAIVAGVKSPFAIEPPSLAWQNALLGFGWLRHLRVPDSEVARARARSLVSDWIAQHGRFQLPSWDPEIVARRIISWICHSPVILEGANRNEYRAFMRSLTRQVRYLRRAIANTNEGQARMTAIIALNFAGLCLSGMPRLQKQSAKWLNDELTSQILPDGGHISRNPGLLIELLLDLLPLRQTFTAREIPPPTALLNSIDRIMPMLRFFRHTDGTFALFNGMSCTPADTLATVLAYDDSHGKPHGNAPYSGYQRMAAGKTTILVDTGAPPPIAVSQKAHAGCLAFEMSTGGQRVIVNCGHPAVAVADWVRAARTTAAHSTASIADTSSSRFTDERQFGSYTNGLLVAGPRNVRVDREENQTGIHLTLSHDGYKSRFDVVHERMLSIDSDGNTLKGHDHFETSRDRTNAAFAIRFHLHPDIRITPTNNDHGLLLNLPNGEIWAFTADGASIEIEESVFLPEPSGAVITSQLVLSGKVADNPDIAWILHRITARPEKTDALDENDKSG